MSARVQGIADYCRKLVRDFDRDRYLACLFAPDAARPHVLALYAFNVELSRIREQVSDPRLGEFRLQWWHDALEGLYASATPETPVAEALSEAIGHGDLPKHAFTRMLEARRFDLYDDPMPDLATLEGYLGETAAALIQLASLLLAGPAASAAAEAAGLAGVAYGLTGLIRSIPVHRARGQCFMAADILLRHGSSPARLLSGQLDEATGNALGDLRRHAAARLAEARNLRSRVPAEAIPAFLPVCLTDLYLARLARKGFDPLKAVADVSQVRKQLRLLRFARAGRF